MIAAEACTVRRPRNHRSQLVFDGFRVLGRPDGRLWDVGVNGRIKIKLNPIRDDIEGKRLVVVGDSIVANLSIEEIRDSLGADSLAYLDLDSMIGAMAGPLPAVPATI